MKFLATGVQIKCLTDPNRIYSIPIVLEEWNKSFPKRTKILERKSLDNIDTYINTFSCLRDNIGILLVS